MKKIKHPYIRTVVNSYPLHNLFSCLAIEAGNTRILVVSSTTGTTITTR